MLDVADNLERAASAVPQAALGAGQELDAAEVQKQLRTLLEGVKMTQQVLNQVSTRCYDRGCACTKARCVARWPHGTPSCVFRCRLSDSMASSHSAQRGKSSTQISTKRCSSCQTPAKNPELLASSQRCEGISAALHAYIADAEC